MNSWRCLGMIQREFFNEQLGHSWEDLWSFSRSIKEHLVEFIKSLLENSLENSWKMSRKTHEEFFENSLKNLWSILRKVLENWWNFLKILGRILGKFQKKMKFPNEFLENTFKKSGKSLREDLLKNSWRIHEKKIWEFLGTFFSRIFE